MVPELLELIPWALTYVAASLLCAGAALLRLNTLAGVSLLVSGGCLCSFAVIVLLLDSGRAGTALWVVVLAIVCAFATLAL